MSAATKEKMKTKLRLRREFGAYLFYGLLAVAVNYAIYLPCYNLFHFSAAGSNVLAWIISAVASLLMNKVWVFHSRDWSAKTLLHEITRFMGTRVVSGILETGIIFLAVDHLGRDGNIWKFVATVIIGMLNYASCKLLVFRQ